MITTLISKSRFNFTVYLNNDDSLEQHVQNAPSRISFTKADIEQGNFEEYLRKAIAEHNTFICDGDLSSIAAQGESAVQFWNNEITEVECELQDMIETGTVTKTAKNELLRTTNSLFKKMAISRLTTSCDAELVKIASEFSWQTRLYNGLVKKIRKQSVDQESRDNALAIMDDLRWLCDLANQVRDDVEISIRNKNNDKFSASQSYRLWNFLTENTTNSINDIIESVKANIEEKRLAQIKSTLDIANHITSHFGKDSCSSDEEKNDILAHYSSKGITIGTYINMTFADAEMVVNNVIAKEICKIREICVRHFYDLKIKSCEPVEFRSDDSHFEGKWILFLDDGEKRNFSFKAIYAGGYNIQRFHIRIKSNFSDPNKE